ncbi:MAG: NAD-dependent epimerase/dehydratase family protein [Pseudomonadales bacterium]
MNCLVIGGSGPTGHFIIDGLIKRGHRVVMLNRGLHPIAETPQDIEHIVCDPYDAAALTAVLGARSFDLCITTYGRLRAIAEIMQSRVGHFISVGGAPAYRGYMNAELYEPSGLPVPIAEDAPLVDSPEQDEKGYRIVKTEQALFRCIPQATHFRYPMVYGPYQLVPREWCIVKRIVDKRPHIIVPDGGLTLSTFGYAENLAHAILLAVDKPASARGQIYNCGDEMCLSLRQVIDVIAKALGHDWEVISMPATYALPALPMLMQPQTTHRVLDIAKLKQHLAYTDVVAPADALAYTAHWLLENPPQPGGTEEMVLQDPFDYAAEDKLVAAWKDVKRQMPGESIFKELPGVGMSYSGPGGRVRSQAEFK